MSDEPDDETAVNGLNTDKPDQRRTPDKPAQRRTPDKRLDELDIGWGERPSEPDRLSEANERLIRDRPPHWE